MAITGIITDEGFNAAQLAASGITYNGSASYGADGQTVQFTDKLLTEVLTTTVTITYTIGGTQYTATDDGAGTITGTSLSGTVEYYTGRLTLNFTTAPDSGTTVSVTYQYRVQGFYLKYARFGVTDQVGSLDPTRTYATGRYTTWYEASVSNPAVVDQNTVQMDLVIPANATSQNQYIREIYLYVEDPQNPGQWLLFGIAQPGSPIEYQTIGELRIRSQFSATNSGTAAVFSYTQATEVGDHAADPNAHSIIQSAMEKAGIYTNPANFMYRGQNFDENAVFDATVADGMLVYKNPVDGVYYPAIDDGTERSEVIGVALTSVSPPVVVTGGLVRVPGLTYQPGQRVYLSGTTPGAFTLTPGEVQVGVMAGNDVVLLKPSAKGTGGGGYGWEEELYSSLLERSSFAQIKYDKFDDPGTVTTVGGASYSSPDGWYWGTTGDEIITPEVLPAGNTTVYYRFEFHLVFQDASGNVVLDEPSFNVMYSTDGGNTWTTHPHGQVHLVQQGFTSLRFRIIWNTTGAIKSYGVLYDESEFIWNTDVRMFEVYMVPSTQAAPVTVTLPNNATYTVDGKSLEVYLNGLRLINGVDFTEVDHHTIQITSTGLNSGDKLLFMEKYGYVDTSVENKSRLDQEHDPSGTHGPLLNGNQTVGGQWNFLQQVGIGGTSPNPHAILDLGSTTQGFLPPRMTTAQRDAIPTPPAGLIIYNTDTNKLNLFTGTVWEQVTSA